MTVFDEKFKERKDLLKERGNKQKDYQWGIYDMK
jgi:hypothetical protein